MKYTKKRCTCPAVQSPYQKLADTITAISTGVYTAKLCLDRHPPGVKSTPFLIFGFEHRNSKENFRDGKIFTKKDTL